MRRKAIRWLLILSFLIILGSVFNADITYSQETIRNKTKIEKLEDKVENLSQLYEQNETFYEVVFHKQNTFLTVIVSALGIILLALIGTQMLFSFRISKDMVNKTVDKAKDDMIKAIEDTRTKLEKDIKEGITEQKTKLTELATETEESLKKMVQISCMDEAMSHIRRGEYDKAVMRLEFGLMACINLKEKKDFLKEIAGNLRKSNESNYPENFRKKLKEKPEIYSGLESEIEEVIKDLNKK